MAASLFGTGETVNVNVNGTLVPQSFTATAGQTVFNLYGWTYTVGTNSLLVFINGQRQVVTRDFTETSSASFTLLEGCVAGDYVDVIGFPQVTLESGATQLRADLASPASGKGDTLITVVAPLTGAVARTQESKNSDFITVTDCYGVGDGVTDDTVAVQSVQSNLVPYTGLSKNYLVDITNYYNFASPSFMSQGLTVKDLGIKVKPATYFKGILGAIDYYSMWRLQGNNQIAFNLQFDGNAQATYAAYAPGGQNIWMIPIQMTANKTGQKALANSINSGGGHAIEGSLGSRMHIALNSATKHNGIGTTNTVGASLIGNISDTTSDAHYFMNTTTNAVAIGNVGNSSNNGGALDLPGNTNFAAVGNVMSGAQQNGTWVLKSPNTSTPYARNLIASNLFYNNCNYPNNEQGEIQIGDFNNLGVAQGSDVAVIGNFALPQDTPSTAGFNAGVWVHAQATRTAVVSNVLSPDAALLSNASSAEFVDKGSIKPIYAGNASFGDTPARIRFDANPSGYSHYANNVNVRIHPSSAGIPSTMESSDGVWNYHIVRKLTKAGKTILDIFYTGGYVHDKIEILLSNNNDNGFAEYRIVSRGSSGAATTVLLNTLLTSVGTNPPVVTLDTTVNGRLRIKANTPAGGFDNEDCGFFIKIITAADAPSRFVPIFA